MKSVPLVERPASSPPARFNSVPEPGSSEEDQVTFLCGAYGCGCDRFWAIPQEPQEEPLRICAECGSPYFWALTPSPQVSAKSMHEVTAT